MGNNLKYPVLSSLVALNFIIGKGFGVRILAFETLSWSDTILWSMLAAGNSYTEKKIMDENCTFAFKKLTLLSNIFKNLLGKLNWSDNCTWIKNCIILSKNYTILFKYCPIPSKNFLRNENIRKPLLYLISFAYEFAIYSFQLISPISNNKKYRNTNQ